MIRVGGMNMINCISKTNSNYPLTYFHVRFVTSNVIAMQPVENSISMCYRKIIDIIQTHFVIIYLSVILK